MTFDIKTVAAITIAFDDFVYFNSREENRVKEMLPVLHNISLQYAFKNARSRYRIHELVPDYENEIARAVHPYYIYPAIPINVNGNIPDFSGSAASMMTTMFPIGWQSDSYRTFTSQTSTNMLQFSAIKVAAPGNVFGTFITSSLAFKDLLAAIPGYIRLGKFSSKARVDVSEAKFSIRTDKGFCKWLVNPVDLPPGLKIGRHYVASLRRMNPNDLIHDVAFNSPVQLIDVTIGNATTSLPVCYNFESKRKT